MADNSKQACYRKLRKYKYQLVRDYMVSADILFRLQSSQRSIRCLGV